jgi:hypothetical protein
MVEELKQAILKLFHLLMGEWGLRLPLGGWRIGSGAFHDRFLLLTLKMC